LQQHPTLCQQLNDGWKVDCCEDGACGAKNVGWAGCMWRIGKDGGIIPQLPGMPKYSGVGGPVSGADIGECSCGSFAGYAHVSYGCGWLD